MKVVIIKNKTGKVVASYTINLQGLNYTPSNEEYFTEAWRCAIEDKVVDADSRSKYSFSFNE
jgi:hypothetical protein